MPVIASTASITSLAPSSTTDDELFENANARILINLYFQEIVNAGKANWQANDDGQQELHLDTGEVFLLQETTITRLK